MEMDYSIFGSEDRRLKMGCYSIIGFEDRGWRSLIFEPLKSINFCSILDLQIRKIEDLPSVLNLSNSKSEHTTGETGRARAGRHTVRRRGEAQDDA